MIDVFAAANTLQKFAFHFLALWRDKHPNLLSYRLGGWIAVDSLGAFIPTGDDAGKRLTDNRVAGKFDDSGEPGFVLFGPLALDELADLAADGIEHLEEVFIRLPELAAETFDDGHHFITELKGKT